MAFGRDTPGYEPPRREQQKPELKPGKMYERISILDFNPNWEKVKEALHGDPDDRRKL